MSRCYRRPVITSVSLMMIMMIMTSDHYIVLMMIMMLMIMTSAHYIVIEDDYDVNDNDQCSLHFH